MISLAYKISHCLSANHYSELRCVICTGVTLFAPVLHFLHWCYTLTALLSANQNRVIFLCVLLSTVRCNAMQCKAMQSNIVLLTDEGMTQEKSVSLTRYGGQFTVFINFKLIKSQLYNHMG